MKTNILTLFFLMIAAYVHGQNIGDILISKSYDNQSIVSILNDIDQHYPIDFYFKKEWIKNNTVSTTWEATSLPLVLEELLTPQELNYMVYSGYAIIIAPANELSKAYSQEFYINQYKSATTRNDDQLTRLAVGDSLNISTNGIANMTGVITDASTSETLPGVTLYIEKINLAATTDAFGQFSMALPIGNHELKVNSIGYEETFFQVVAYSNGSVTIPLQEKAVKLDEIVVAAQKDDSNIRSAQMGITTLSMKEVKEVPTFMGEADVIKTLLLQPSVTTVGEGASGFNVRGGNIDQNLIMQDGGLVFNSSHVLGFFSIFNADIVEEATLYTGSIPAQYGGRLSSVLDVQLKDGDFEKWYGNGGIGIVSSRLSFHGPLIKDKTSLLIGLRSSYSDWILREFENPDLSRSSIFFYDGTAKLTHKFSQKSKIDLSYYNSFDEFQYSDQFGFDWATQFAALNFNNILFKKLSSATSISYGSYGSSLFEPEGVASFTLTNGIDFLKGKQNFLWSPSPSHDISFGGEWTRYQSKPETIHPLAEESGIVPQSIKKQQGQEFGVYINDEYIINNTLSASLGIRYSWYQQLGPESVTNYEANEPRNDNTIVDTTFFGAGKIVQYGGLEPRISFKITTSPTSSVKVSYNRMNQYIHLISNTAASTPVDFWQVSTTYIPPQIANNFSVGYFQNFAGNLWESSLQLYYRDIEQIVEYKDLPSLLLNPGLEMELLTGEGQAYGAEFLLKKRTGKLTGQFSYTYNRSLVRVQGNSLEETVNDGEWFPSNFDKPHNVNLSMKYRANKRSVLSMNFVYNSGRPVTAPIGNYAIDGVTVTQYSLRNQFRIPAYHRLDLSYTLENRAIKKVRYKGSWTFTIYNVYARRNPFSVYFQRNQFARFKPSAYRLSIIGTAFPSITYNFKF